MLARAFDRLNKDGEAETHFRQAMEADPDYSPALSAYSQWLIVHQRDTDAYAAAQKAVRLNTGNTEAQHTLLQYYSNRSDWGKLRQTAAAVLQTDPTDADGKRSASVAETAFDAVRTAEAKAKNDPSVDQFLALSVQYYRTDRFDDSISACRQALKLRPDLAEAYSNMAAAQYAMGQVDDAMKSLQEALRIRPDLELARKNLDYLTALKAGKVKAEPAR
jgi:tetratricopeptide (TPR) repeat protein